MPRLLLLLPTSTYRAPDFVDAASSIGVDVVIASDRRQPLAETIEGRSLVVDFDDPVGAADAISEFAEQRPLDAIVAVDDESVRVAAEANDRLELIGNDVAAVARTRDKAEMRAALAAAGVAQPAYVLALTAPDDLWLPCVVKPLCLSASRGVIRADTPAQAAAAAARVRRILAQTRFHAGGPLLFEEFVAGPEVAVEGLIYDGRLEVLAIFDKPDPLDGPYFEETLFITPARISDATRRDVEEITRDAARALGLADGPIHAELRLAVDGPRVIEIAARSIGGLCSRTLRFGAGISLEVLILRHALGETLEMSAQTGLTSAASHAASGVMMLPIPREGVLESVEGVAAAAGVEGIEGVEITIAPGRLVRPLPEGDRYLGFVFARADTPDAVEAALRDAFEQLEIDIR